MILAGRQRVTEELQQNLNQHIPEDPPQQVEDREYEEGVDDVTKPPSVWRHPLEDIPIDEPEPSLHNPPRRQLKKNSQNLPRLADSVPESLPLTIETEPPPQFVSVPAPAAPAEHVQDHLPKHVIPAPKTDSFLIPAAQEQGPVPPQPKIESGNFVSKSGSVTAFDKAAYMAEYRKKLLGLTEPVKETPESSSPATKRPLFTLPAHVFEQPTEEPNLPPRQPIPVYVQAQRHRQEPQDSNDILAETVIETTTAAFPMNEKIKVEKTLNELQRPADQCDEPLHPRLEEDCNNEDWVCVSVRLILTDVCCR